MLNEGEVRIIFAGQELTFEIEDLDLDILSQAFNGLHFIPKILKDEKTHKIIKLPSKPNERFTKLKSGKTYVIPTPPSKPRLGKGDETATPVLPDNWASDFVPDMMQNAVVACRAVYLDTDEECGDFLNNHITNHHFECLFRSHYGDCPFLVAEEIGAQRVYISFRGTQTTQDWTNNLKAFQIKNMDQVPQGKLHSGFLERAQTFPFDKLSR